MNDAKNITDLAEYLKQHAQQIELHVKPLLYNGVKEVTDTEKRLVEHNRAVELPRPINRTFVTTLFQGHFTQDADSRGRLEKKQEQGGQTRKELQQKT